MEYLYSVTATYDGDRSPHWVGRYDNAIDALRGYQLYIFCTESGRKDP